MRFFKKPLVLIGLLLLFSNCDFRSTGRMYREDFIIPSQGGIIDSTELWKGGLLLIKLADNDKKAQIMNNEFIINQIKEGDYFKKMPNSNKCYIRRNDSILYFDCISFKKLKKETLDDIGMVNQWQRNQINRWMKFD